MSRMLLHPLVIKALDDWRIVHEVIQCNPEWADTTEFCANYGFPISTSANAILVASTRGIKTYALGVVPASHRLDVNHQMRRLMGVSRASFARPEEIREVTGMEIGGVTPFGLPSDCPVYLDDGIRGLEYVILGAGTRLAKLKVLPGELAKIPNSTFVTGLGSLVS